MVPDVVSVVTSVVSITSMRVAVWYGSWLWYRVGVVIVVLKLFSIRKL